MRPTPIPSSHTGDVDENAPTILSERIAPSHVHDAAFEAELDRYALGEKLGSGGMAAVFRAKDRVSGDVVALKIIENGDDDPSRQARFMREVRAAGGLVHENVCRVLSFGRAPAKLFMAMEIVEGSTLQRVIKARGTMPVPLALEALRQLLQALECAHDKGVVHRDLKPANVMITPQGTLKLLDFGIAKSQEDETVTATGLLVGTPAFMAPEQILGAVTDTRSDLFSAGVTFLVMLTGRTRFSGQDPAAVMVKVTSEPVPSLLEECPAASAAVEALLSKLCAQKMEERFQTATEALAALDTVDELPSRAEGKRLLARALVDPDEVAKELAERTARSEKARAARLLQLGPAAFPAAALSLHRASLLVPAEDTRKELARVCAAGSITFDPVDDVKVSEAMAAFDKTPNAAGVLKRLADLYRARGHVLLAAAFLTRYLRVKPQDTVAAQQLRVLLDGPSSAESATGASDRLRTRDIVAGIKTGGQVAPSFARATASPTMNQALADSATMPNLSVVARSPAGPARDGSGAGVGAQSRVATPSVIVAGGRDGRASASIHPVFLVVGAVVVAGLVMAFFGRFVRTTVDDVQLAISDNTARVGATEQASIERLRKTYLEEATGHLARGNHAAAARQVNLLLATNPPAELALEAMWVRAQARLRLGDPSSARIDLEEYLKQSTLEDPHRAEAKQALDAIYAEKAAAADRAAAPPVNAAPVEPTPKPEGLY